jgi:hypothetical protein
MASNSYLVPASLDRCWGMTGHLTKFQQLPTTLPVLPIRGNIDYTFVH